MRCCRNILMNNELKYLHIYVVGAIAQLLVMRNTYSYLLCEETAIPEDLNDSLVSIVVDILETQLNAEDHTGILICLTCMSSLCVYSITLFFFSDLVHQCSQLCNNQMFSLLFRVTDIYFDDLMIMQHVSTITMFFAGLEGWESSLMESGLIQKITSFTYSVCQDPLPSISLSSSVYPLVSITRNLSLSRRAVSLFSFSASGIDFIFRYHLLSCIKDVYIHCRGTNNLSDLVCCILLRLTSTSRFYFVPKSHRREL